MEPKRSPFESRLNLRDLSFISKSQLLGTPETMDETTKENDKFEHVVDGQAKFDLIKQSQFFKLVNNGSNRSNCNILFLEICSHYNVENDTFQIRGESMRITLEDVAFLLGLKLEGSKPAAKLKSSEWDPLIEEVCTKYSKENPKKDERLEKKNIQNILRKMKISNKKERLQFRKLFSFYMVSFIVYPTSSYQACVSNFIHVQDLDAFEKVNWAQEILYQLQNCVTSYNNGNGKRFICCFTLLLEAWFYRKTRLLTDENTEESEEAAPISKFLGKCYSSREQCQKLLSGHTKSDAHIDYKPDLDGREKNPSELIEYHTNALLEAYSEKLVRQAILEEKNVITGCGLPWDEDVIILKLKQKHCGSTEAKYTDLVEAFKSNPGLYSPSGTKRGDLSYNDRFDREDVFGFVTPLNNEQDAGKKGMSNEVDHVESPSASPPLNNKQDAGKDGGETSRSVLRPTLPDDILKIMIMLVEEQFLRFDQYLELFKASEKWADEGNFLIFGILRDPDILPAKKVKYLLSAAGFP